MTKKEYMKPVTKVEVADIEQQILAGSVTSVTTTGLDEDLTLPDDEVLYGGSVWDDAW